tara:strand:+ start:250 stop:1230 length:981 start_codon:yes stop_codon:yes gene_type:complete
MAHLKNHKVMSTADLDDLRDTVNRLAGPHRFEVKGAHQGLQADMAATTVGNLGLFHLSFGDVEIEVSSEENDSEAFAVCLLTSGVARAREGKTEIDATVDRAAVRDLSRAISGWEKDFASFGLVLPKERLRAHAQALIGEGTDVFDMDFERSVDLTTAEGRLFAQTVRYVADMVDGPLRELDNPLFLRQLEDLLLNQVLTLLPNTLQDEILGRPRAHIVSQHVKRARDHIQAHAGARIGLADLAAAAGCSYRALQEAFQDAYGMSPMAYLRRVRLHKVRAALLSQGGRCTVSEIAALWGFAHMGRFAQAYRCQFGELPSETLRRGR